jgi:hypothetical protein
VLEKEALKFNWLPPLVEEIWGMVTIASRYYAAIAVAQAYRFTTNACKLRLAFESSLYIKTSWVTFLQLAISCEQ